MKFGNTGRDITDKNKFMNNKPRGSFLERFKGRTIQINKEGHLGVVHSTKMPIKPMHDQGQQPYNSNKQHEHHSALVKKPAMGTNRGEKSKNNFEALSPFKRSNSIDTGGFTEGNDRYNAFARNFKKTENVLSHSYNSPGLRKGLSKAGGDILRQSYNSSMKEEYPKMGSSHSMVPETRMNNSSLTFNSNLKAPNSSKDNLNPYSSMKIPLAMAAGLKGGENKLEIPVQK